MMLSFSDVSLAILCVAVVVVFVVRWGRHVVKLKCREDGLHSRETELTVTPTTGAGDPDSTV